MLRIFSFFIFLTFSFAAFAAQNYIISFQNDSMQTVWVKAKAGDCMHEWNEPPSYTKLKPGETLGPYSIQDKNSGGCAGEAKTNYWYISKDQTDNDYIRIEFVHKQENGWRTKFYKYDPGNLKYNVSDVTCDGKPCLDPNSYKSSNGYPIIVKILDN